MRSMFRADKVSVSSIVAMLCVLGVIAALGLSAAMGMGVIRQSGMRLIGVVAAVGSFVCLGLWFLLRAAGSRYDNSALHAPEMSTLAFPPRPQSLRRKHLVRIK